jgi:hypothetical protein
MQEESVGAAASGQSAQTPASRILSIIFERRVVRFVGLTLVGYGIGMPIFRFVGTRLKLPKPAPIVQQVQSQPQLPQPVARTKQVSRRPAQAKQPQQIAAASPSMAQGQSASVANNPESNARVFDSKPSYVRVLVSNLSQKAVGIRVPGSFDYLLLEPTPVENPAGWPVHDPDKKEVLMVNIRNDHFCSTPVRLAVLPEGGQTVRIVINDDTLKKCESH